MCACGLQKGIKKKETDVGVFNTHRYQRVDVVLGIFNFRDIYQKRPSKKIFP